MKAGLPQREPEALKRWQDIEPVREAARHRQGPSDLHPA